MAEWRCQNRTMSRFYLFFGQSVRPSLRYLVFHLQSVCTHCRKPSLPSHTVLRWSGGHVYRLPRWGLGHGEGRWLCSLRAQGRGREGAPQGMGQEGAQRGLGGCSAGIGLGGCSAEAGASPCYCTWAGVGMEGPPGNAGAGCPVPPVPVSCRPQTPGITSQMAFAPHC